jgi:hypothetical protein
VGAGVAVASGVTVGVGVGTGVGEGAGVAAGAGAGVGAGAGAAGVALRGVEPRGFGRVPGRPSIGLLTQRTLLEQHVRAAVTIDRDNRVLYYHGNTRPFLEQPAGEPTRDLMALCREGMRGSVRVAVHRCAAEQRAVTVVDGWVEVAEGRQSRVSVTASPVSVEDPAHPEYFVVSFDQLEEMRRTGGAARGDGRDPGHDHGQGPGVRQAQARQAAPRGPQGPREGARRGRGR